MKRSKSLVALCMCLVFLLLLFPSRSMADDSTMPDFWIREKEDLSMLIEAVREYLLFYEKSSITFCFAKKLVDEYTVDGLIGMCRRAGNMSSVDGFEIGYRTLSDGTLRVELANIRIRSGEKMLDAFLFDDRSGLTSEESRCLDQVIQVMNGLIRQYPQTSLELETAIYDYICDHVTYQTYPRSDARWEACTSVCNAFMKGWGNCQAYSDLFCLMASIGGFQTGLISGVAGESHMWNWIATWFDGEYRVYMVDVTFGDNDGKSKTDHFYLNFGLDRVDNHTWEKELFLFNEFERYTDDAFTYYNSYSGYCAYSLADAVELCNSLARGGHRKAEILVFQKGIWEDEIQAALIRIWPRSSWQFSCFSHDVGVVISVWW